MSEDGGLQQFPCDYMFKVFGRRSDAFIERVREIIAGTLGSVPAEAVTVRESSHGRYVSVTVLVRVDTRSQLERVYADLRAEAEVLLYI